MVINLSDKEQAKRQFGLNLKKARKASGKSVKECSEVLGISKKLYEAFEMGEEIPSLPVLESVSFYFDFPIEFFFTGESTYLKKREKVEQNLERFIMLRRRLIGALIRQKRDELELTLQDLAIKTDIEEAVLQSYEFGEVDIPYFDLELIATALNISVDEFRDQNGPISAWLEQQRLLDKFQELPLELQEFIVRPVNEPYLDLAKKMSEMPVDKLRAFAEALLEITF